MRTPPRHARRAAARQDEAEEAHRLGAVGRLREERHDQRERDGRHDGAAESLHRTGADEHPLRRGQAADQGREREDRDPDQEQAPRAEQVAEAAAQEQEPAEGQEVRVHDPCQRGLREAEIVADRRQRDVHDRRVEDDHQVAQAEHVQSERDCGRQRS